jgi:phage terminase Nu1 subunit (DNA packaging protein)
MSTRTQTAEEIIELLTIDPSTLKRWKREGLPCDNPIKGERKHCLFNVDEVKEWMVANKKSGKPGRPAAPQSAELLSWKLRKEKASALRVERENAIAEGKLIDAADEAKRDIQKIVTIRNKLCSMGATLSPQLEGLDAAERCSLIDSTIESILKEFAT